jgi:hypothetical protein
MGECQETHSGPWCFDLNGSWHSPQGSAALKKVDQLSDQKWFSTRWRRSDSGQRNVCNDECCRFLTISGNVLNVVEKAGCEEPAGWLHPHPGGLLEGVEGGTKNAAAADFTNALRQW